MILPERPQLDISVSIVWIPMLRPDSEHAATHAAQFIDGPNVQHFYDAQHHAGRAVAASIGGQGEIAWDMYLFYPKGVLWEQAPPQPLGWTHQLGASWANLAYQRCGDDLIKQLQHMMDEFIRVGR